MSNVSVYADNGYSGCKEQRPEFQRMLHDIDSGMYKILVIDDLNRLSRNISHLRRIVDELIRKKIQVFIVNGNPMLTKK
ncbi:MAG: recombinase family protein [Anaerolineaceae bacterium]|nr:recombinase family protein [Anaerolineaceae bacterium]